MQCSPLCAYPTNSALLVNFRLSSDAEIFVNKHRLSMQVGAERARMRMQRVRIPTELPFCIPPLLVGHNVFIKKHFLECKKKHFLYK